MNTITNYMKFLFTFMLFPNIMFSQAYKGIPIIEDFEKDTAWHWHPWELRSTEIESIVKHAAYTGNYGLIFLRSGYYINNYVQIGRPNEVISAWFKFYKHGRLNLGFGLTNTEKGYFLCVDPSTNTLHFANSPDYTFPILKSNKQIYQMNQWYRIEILFNTRTNITAKLFTEGRSEPINTINYEIPNLVTGGIAIRGQFVCLDEIRGGNLRTDFNSDYTFDLKIGELLVLKNIDFESNSALLLPESFDELNRLIKLLKIKPSLKLSIYGHTDSIGNDIDNMKLSYDRAKAVANYLIKNGINQYRLKTYGFGSDKPIASNMTDGGRKINRRVEVIIQ